MRKVALVLVAVVAGFSMTSCATILGGGGAKQIPVTVSGAYDYEISVNGINYGDASVIEVSKGDLVTITADGYKQSVTQIQGKFNATTLLNLVWGGLIGIVVDAATGNITKVTTPVVSVKLRKEKN